MRQQLFSRGAAGSGGRDTRRQIGSRAAFESSDYEPPLGPHQQQEMRQRVLEAARTGVWWEKEYENVLECEEAVDMVAVLVVFLAELRCALTATRAVTNRGSGRRGRVRTMLWCWDVLATMLSSFFCLTTLNSGCV
jgi:hypothetical protein